MSAVEQRNYEDILRPVVPSEKILPHLRKKKDLTHRTVYRAGYQKGQDGKRQKVVKCVCSGCGAEYTRKHEITVSECSWSRPPAPFGFVADDGCLIYSGRAWDCPHCRCKTQALHIGNIRGGEAPIKYYFVQEIRKIEGILVLLQWRYGQSVDKEAKEHWRWDRYNAFVIEDRKIVRMNGMRKMMFGATSPLDHFEQTKKYMDDYGSICDLMPWDKRILKGTPAENSKLDLYLKLKKKGLFPVSYLRLYLKHNNVENLMTCGAGRLVADMIMEQWREYSGYSHEVMKRIPQLKDVDWKKVKPHEMLGLDKPTLRRAVEEKWDVKMLRMHRVAVSGGETLSRQELKDGCGLGLYGRAEEIAEYAIAVRKTIRYLKRQKKNVTYLMDYYSMAKMCGHDMTDPAVLWPKDLTAAHDRANELKKVAGLKVFHEAFLRRAEELGRFSWEKDGILIRPVADEAELVREGDKLNHCVATYAKRHCEAGCAILLVRRADDPDEPWFTLNLNEKSLSVTENRGLRNCGRTPEVRAFEDAWLEHIRSLKKQRKSKKEGNAA